MTTSTHPYHPPKPSPGSKAALTSYGRDGSSLIAHSCKIKLEELPGITLIDFNLEVFPLVYHLILRIGNWKEMWEGGSCETGKPWRGLHQHGDWAMFWSPDSGGLTIVVPCLSYLIVEIHSISAFAEHPSVPGTVLEIQRWTRQEPCLQAFIFYWVRQWVYIYNSCNCSEKPLLLGQ